MQQDAGAIDQIIRNRRAVFPQNYSDQPIPKSEISTILELANFAPTHRLTQPWRFKVFTGKKLKALSDYLGDYYLKHTPEEKYSPIKYKKTVKKPLQSSCVIAICMQRDPEARIPEWEEIAAVAMAVQNMWLGCAARNIGAYWSSPKAALSADKFLDLKQGERCLGLFYMGYSTLQGLEANRTPMSDKTEWLE